MCLHKQALKVVTLLKDTDQLMDTYNDIGTIKYYLAQYNNVLYYFDLGKAYLNQVKSKFTIGALYNNYGLTYQANGKLEDAINSHIQAAKYFEMAGRADALILTNNNIGSLYIEHGFYNKALNLFKKKMHDDEQ